MSGTFLSRVSWRETFIFMAIRIAFASVVVFAVVAPGYPSGEMFGLLIMTPVVVIIMSGISLVMAWLSQMGVPFAGLISLGFGLPMLIGDPFVWVLHKIKREWVPVDEPRFFNPPIVWVEKDLSLL